MTRLVALKRVRTAGAPSVVALALAGMSLACGGQRVFGAEDTGGEGSGTDGGEDGAPDVAPDLLPETGCGGAELSVIWDVPVELGPESRGDAVVHDGGEIVVAGVANGHPTLAKLRNDGAALWNTAWPDYAGVSARLDVGQEGRSAIFAELVDGTFTALLDEVGAPIWERRVPTTGYVVHPTAVALYPGSDLVFRAAWRTYMDDEPVGILGRIDDPYGADVWDIVLVDGAAWRVDDMVLTGPDEQDDWWERVAVGSRGDQPWVGTFAVDDGKELDETVDAGATASFSAVAASQTGVVLGGSCEEGGKRWGFVVPTSAFGEGLEQATGACPAWADRELLPVADLTVMDDLVIAISNPEADMLSVFRDETPTTRISMSILLGRPVEVHAIDAGPNCSFALTGRDLANPGSFVALVAAGP